MPKNIKYSKTEEVSTKPLIDLFDSGCKGMIPCFVIASIEMWDKNPINTAVAYILLDIKNAIIEAIININKLWKKPLCSNNQPIIFTLLPIFDLGWSISGSNPEKRTTDINNI